MELTGLAIRLDVSSWNDRLELHRKENGQPAPLGVCMSPESTISTEEFIPTRYTLLSRLQDWEDNESWKDFFDTMVKAKVYAPDFDYKAAYTLQFVHEN